MYLYYDFDSIKTKKINLENDKDYIFDDFNEGMI